MNRHKALESISSESVDFNNSIKDLKKQLKALKNKENNIMWDIVALEDFMKKCKFDLIADKQQKHEYYLMCNNLHNLEEEYNVAYKNTSVIQSKIWELEKTL